MPKKPKTTRLQPKPISLYDPAGSLAYTIDSLAAILEYKTGLPVNRVAAVRKAVDSSIEGRKIDDGLTDDQIEKLVIDWRSRHGL